MQALERNGTWESTNLPKGKCAVGCKWVFTIKYNPDGSIQWYKVIFVAKGFIQAYGIDYLEIFPPVAKLNSTRVILSLLANFSSPILDGRVE